MYLWKEASKVWLYFPKGKKCTNGSPNLEPILPTIARYVQRQRRKNLQRHKNVFFSVKKETLL
jgi:hypothetical protein